MEWKKKKKNKNKKSGAAAVSVSLKGFCAWGLLAVPSRGVPGRPHNEYE